jgi:hypothetical protein
MWIYSIMMITCTLAFFQIIVFVLLTISISIYLGYKSCGLSILAERMSLRPQVVWYYIDMGVFAMMDPVNQDELGYQYDENERRY